jgi:hypothetical protein
MEGGERTSVAGRPDFVLKCLEGSVLKGRCGRKGAVGRGCSSREGVGERLLP